MQSVFLLTLQQLSTFLIIFGIGIVMRRLRVLPDSASSVFARLITWIFLPAASFSSFAHQFTLPRIGEYAQILAGGTLLMLLSLPLAAFMRRRMPGNTFEKLTVAYSMVVPNFAYFGYPLMTALFGQEMLSKLMMFGLPFNFFIYGWAMPQWMPWKPGRLARIKRSFSPPLVAMLLGILWGLSDIPCPRMLDEVCASFSNCMAPCAMLVSGLAIGRIKLRGAFAEKRVCFISVIRLVLLPVLFGSFAYAMCALFSLSEELLLVLGVYVSVPLGMNPVVFSESYGADGSFGASCALVSMVLSIATLPVMMGLLTHIAAAL